MREPAEDRVGEYRGDPLYHASLSPDQSTVLLSSIGLEVIAHAVEDWKTGGGCTVWLTRASAMSADDGARCAAILMKSGRGN